MAINPSFSMCLQHLPNSNMLILESQFDGFGIQETRFEFSIADRDTIVWSWLLTF